MELVHRRAYTVYGGVRKPLMDNITVEKALGDKGIICLNDLSNVIFSIGTHFEAANKLLCTFHLASPTGHYEKKVLQIHDEVEDKGGFLGGGMELFLQKIL